MQEMIFKLESGEIIFEPDISVLIEKKSVLLYKGRTETSELTRILRVKMILDTKGGRILVDERTILEPSIGGHWLYIRFSASGKVMEKGFHGRLYLTEPKQEKKS